MSRVQRALQGVVTLARTTLGRRMSRVQPRSLVVFIVGVLLVVVPFYAAFTDVGRGSSLFAFRQALLLAVVPGALLYVHGVASLYRGRLQALTPPVAWAVPLGVALLFLLETTTPDIPPIDPLGPGPRPEAWWQDLLGALNPKLLGASVLVVAGVATRRREWRWFAPAVGVSVVCALAGAAYISGWPPVSHVVWRSLGDAFTLGLIPFLWGLGFAAARE